MTQAAAPALSNPLATGLVLPPSAPDTIDGFMRFKHPERIAKNKFLYRDGPEHFYHVTHGVVRLYREGPRRNVGVGMYGAGDWFGEGAVFGTQYPYEIAQAVTECSFIRWTPAEVLASCESPSGAHALTAIAIEHRDDMEARLSEYRYAKVYRRVISQLLRLDKSIGQPGDGMAIIPRQLPRMTHEVLAQDIGTSRELITSSMNRLRREGAVTYSRRGIALSPDVLRALLVAKDEDHA